MILRKYFDDCELTVRRAEGEQAWGLEGEGPSGLPIRRGLRAVVIPGPERGLPDYHLVHRPASVSMSGGGSSWRGGGGGKQLALVCVVLYVLKTITAGALFGIYLVLLRVFDQYIRASLSVFMSEGFVTSSQRRTPG